LERISELSGFEHPEYMSVVFKRLYSQTPGQYRKQMRPNFQNSLLANQDPAKREGLRSRDPLKALLAK